MNRVRGGSTLAANLATRAADLGLGRILIVDANLAGPCQSRLLGVGDGPGLSDVLAGVASLTDAIHQSTTKGLDVLTAGTVGNGEVAVAPDVLAGLVSELRSDYELVLFDLVPVSDSASSIVFQINLDGVLLVLRAEKTKATRARVALNLLEEGGTEVIGAVLNRQSRDLPAWLDRWL